MLATDLVKRVGNGESEAEEFLYATYSARVYFLALSELHSKQDAEDVRAETFLRVIQALRSGKLRSPDSLPAFIIGFALNVIRELRRQRNRIEPLDGHDFEGVSGGTVEDAYLDSVTRRAVEQTVSLMKPRERLFLRLYFYEELPNEVISARLGIKAERLRLIKSRALRSLREMLSKL